MHQAVTSFDIEKWDESPCPETGLHEATVTGRYHGDLTGTGAWRMVLGYLPDETASCVWLERVTGRLGDREGGFVLQHAGRFADGIVRVSFEVVPGSGTGELATIRGRGGYSVSEGRTIQKIVFDYDFAE